MIRKIYLKSVGNIAQALRANQKQPICINNNDRDCIINEIKQRKTFSMK